MRIFDLKEKKLEIWEFRRNFPYPEVAYPNQPDMGQNFLIRTHHYDNQVRARDGP